MSWLFMIIPEFYTMIWNDMFYNFHLQINYVTFWTHDCKIFLLVVFLFNPYVAERIYNNLSGDLSRLLALLDCRVYDTCTASDRGPFY